jgi:hypothetical protein
MDSGIDPFVEGLQTTSTGAPKLVDLRDFSGEGQIALTKVTPEGENVTVGGKTLTGFGRLRGVSTNGPWYAGTIREIPLGKAPASDINWNNANTYNFRSGFVPPTNQWSFVGMVVTPSNAVVYAGTPPGPLQTATNVLAHTSDVFGNNWQIGNDNNDNLNSGSRGFLGSIDEVAVFTKSLTFAQMQQLYSVGLNGAPVTLNIQPSGGNVVLTWSTGTLQSASDVNGPYADVSSATSPYTVSATGTQQFFRVRVH